MVDGDGGGPEQFATVSFDNWARLVAYRFLYNHRCQPFRFPNNHSSQLFYLKFCPLIFHTYHMHCFTKCFNCWARVWIAKLTVSLENECGTVNFIIFLCNVNTGTMLSSIVYCVQEEVTGINFVFAKTSGWSWTFQSLRTPRLIALTQR